VLAEHGKDGFYKGRIAQAIVDIVNDNGGKLTLDDLENHSSAFCDPISTTYEGIRVWEIPPNGSGIIVLLVLNILKNFPMKGKGTSLNYHLCKNRLLVVWFIVSEKCVGTHFR
jgi:gamma-glutamyltranspeptidase/glutathione hydrolase